MILKFYVQVRVIIFVSPQESFIFSKIERFSQHIKLFYVEFAIFSRIIQSFEAFTSLSWRIINLA